MTNRTFALLAALPLLACGGGTRKADTPTTDVTVVRTGDTTVVSVQDHTEEPENAVCKAYCERLTKCWYAVPNADPMLAPKDVYAKCWAEQHQCRTPMTEVHCCSSSDSCPDFVKCETTARDVVTDCRKGAVSAGP